MKRRTFRIFAALLIELSTSIVCIFLFWNVCVSEQSDIRSLWIRSFLGIDHQFMSICFGFIFCDLIFLIFFSPHILIAEKNLGEQIMRKKDWNFVRPIYINIVRCNSNKNEQELFSTEEQTTEINETKNLTAKFFYRKLNGILIARIV